jgi:hypothetical protein
MANPWGSAQYGIGEFGTGLQNVTLTLDSLPMSATAGNLGTDGEVNTGWGRLTWSAQAWGIAGTLVLQGNPLTITSGTAESGVSKTITLDGSALTVTSGTAPVDIAVEIFQQGNLLNITSGSLDPAPDVELSGTNLEARLLLLEMFLPLILQVGED